MCRIFQAAEAALAAALFFGCVFAGCVSVEDYEGLRKQLAAEQALVREQDAETGALRQVVRKQRHDLRNLRLEIDEAKNAFPAVAAVAKEAWETEPVLAGTLSFAPGSQKLTDKDVENLQSIAKKIAARGYAAILVDGHSDPTPLSAKSLFRSNMHLSTVRALAVYHALVSMPGVDASRVRVVGLAEFRPRPGREKSDRRVEVRYVPARAAGRAASKSSVGKPAAALRRVQDGRAAGQKRISRPGSPLE